MKHKHIQQPITEVSGSNKLFNRIIVVNPVAEVQLLLQEMTARQYFGD